MDEFITPSIVAALTSLIISLITLYQFFRSQESQRKQFEKSLDRNFTSKMYDLRLEHYPKAFEITDNIYKEKGGGLDHSKIKSICEDLIEWRKGVISLIISIEARDSFFVLRDTLLKNPANGTEYSENQIQKIVEANRYFRKQLRRDLGFLFREEKARRENN